MRLDILGEVSQMMQNFRDRIKMPENSHHAFQITMT